MMPIMYSSDPVRDFEEHDREAEKWLNSRPICDMCGHHIQEDYYFDADGDTLCERCFNEYFVRDNFLKYIEE